MLQNISSRKIYWGVLGLMILLGFLALKNKLRLVSYQQDPNQLAMAFWESLKNNDESMAKSLALANQHERISSWIDTHQPTKCGFLSFEFTAQDNYSTNNEQITISMYCETYKGVYCFSVQDMWVKKIEQKWFIVDWGIIREGNRLYDGNETGDCP